MSKRAPPNFVDCAWAFKNGWMFVDMFMRLEALSSLMKYKLDLLEWAIISGPLKSAVRLYIMHLSTIDPSWLHHRCLSRHCDGGQAHGEWTPSISCDYNQGNCRAVCRERSGILQHCKLKNNNNNKKQQTNHSATMQ